MLQRKVASIAWISAVHGGGGSSSSSSGGNGGGGGGLLHPSGGSHRGSGSLLGNRRVLLLLRGVLGFGAGSTLYWTVGSCVRSMTCNCASAVLYPEPSLSGRDHSRKACIMTHAAGCAALLR